MPLIEDDLMVHYTPVPGPVMGKDRVQIMKELTGGQEPETKLKNNNNMESEN